MQRQRPFWPYSSFFDAKAQGLNEDPLTATMMANKRKNYQNPEQEFIVSTELSISYPGTNKKPKTSATSSSAIAPSKKEPTVNAIVASTENKEFLTKNYFSKEEISTELTLFDKSWITKSGKSTEVSVHNSSLSIEKPVSNDKLNQMVISGKISSMKFYSPGEEEEERLMGVSTKLKLFEDPWKVNKILTVSDVGGLGRLLLKKGQVMDYVLPLLSPNRVKEVENNGLRVMVWDQDTKSLHQVVFKRWRVTGSYFCVQRWSSDFVHRRNLMEGDEIGLYWDKYDSRFNFRVLRRAQNVQPAV